MKHGDIIEQRHIPSEGREDFEEIAKPAGHLPGLEEIKGGADMAEVYAEMEAVSLTADFENAEDVVVISASFPWSDMEAEFCDVLPPDENGNIIRGRVVDIGSSNSIIFGCDRVVATIGLKDIILVDTPDATLVCPKTGRGMKDEKRPEEKWLYRARHTDGREAGRIHAFDQARATR